MPSTDATLNTQDLELLRKDFSASATYRLAQNAVTRVTVDDVAINREIINSTDHSLSTLLDDWKVTAQKRSGRLPDLPVQIVLQQLSQSRSGGAGLVVVILERFDGIEPNACVGISQRLDERLGLNGPLLARQVQGVGAGKSFYKLVIDKP